MLPGSSTSTPRPRPPAPRRRTRTMSYSIRATEEHKSSRSKKVVIALLVILTLFLVGTVIVLSSVSFYLAIPSSAYLDESEVQWTPDDAVPPLLYSPDGVAGAQGQVGDVVEAVTRRQVIEEEIEEGHANEEGDRLEEGDWLEEGDRPEGDWVEEGDRPEGDRLEEDVWDVDGRGSGAYWMRKDWDGTVRDTERWDRLLNVTTRPGEKIPRLIHQTWKDEHLPEKWRKAWKECREGMPDYEYMLWTDDTALEFVKTHYPHHLHMFESYKYPIMRADSIRYFILHHFGGIYMDLDIGCRRRLDPLLQGDWDTILPITKPVGVSNDLIFSAKGSAFMDHTVHALPAWDHDWLMNYPTVMFSTGPMFLSAQYAIYSAAHPITAQFPRAEVRILPKSLYGKNVPADQVPHSFFSHFYGSSWHAEDAGFVTFLGAWGKALMYIGVVVLVGGIIRLVYLKITSASKEYHLLSILPTHSGSTTPTGTHSPAPFSPPTIEAFAQNQLPNDITSALRRAGNLILAAPATLLSGDRRSNRRRQGLLYFVPALFQPTAPARRGRTASEASQIPLRRSRRDRERERERERARVQDPESDSTSPPPYDQIVERASLCSSPDPIEKRRVVGTDEEDGYIRSESSSSEYETNEWDWKDQR